MKSMMNRAAGYLMACVLACTSTLALADESKKQEAEQIANSAAAALQSFTADESLTNFSQNLRNAKAILVIPSYTKAGFIFGGAGGAGALVAKDKANKWVGPAFYNMGEASFGLQAGVENVEIILLVMTENGLNSLLSTDLKLGAGASVSAGTAGGGAGAQTADILSYGRTKGGLFAGLKVEGAIIKPAEKRNDAYYGKPVSPVDILVTGNVQVPPSGKDLLATAAKVAK